MLFLLFNHKTGNKSIDKFIIQISEYVICPLLNHRVYQYKKRRKCNFNTKIYLRRIRNKLLLFSFCIKRKRVSISILLKRRSNVICDFSFCFHPKRDREREEQKKKLWRNKYALILPTSQFPLEFFFLRKSAKDWRQIHSFVCFVHSIFYLSHDQKKKHLHFLNECNFFEVKVSSSPFLLCVGSFFFCSGYSTNIEFHFNPFS